MSPGNYGAETTLVMCHAGSTGPNTPGVFDADSTWSPHQNGVPYLFGDGSVHFIGNSIDIPTWMALATRAGGVNPSTAAAFLETLFSPPRWSSMRVSLLPSVCRQNQTSLLHSTCWVAYFGMLFLVPVGCSTTPRPGVTCTVSIITLGSDGEFTPQGPMTRIASAGVNTETKITHEGTTFSLLVRQDRIWKSDVGFDFSRS